MLSTSLRGSEDLAANVPKGRGQQGHLCLPGIRVLQQQQQRACNIQDSDFSLSLCLFISSSHLPPTNISRSSVGLHLRGYFGLTFRVSLRLISLFSSISSCSLRAAENERKKKKIERYTAGTSVWEITEKGNKHTICIMCFIRFTLKRTSFLKTKIVSITDCLIRLGMGIRGEQLPCSF